MLKNSKYSKVLTIVLVIVIIGVLIGGIFLTRSLIMSAKRDKEKNAAIEEFENSIIGRTDPESNEIIDNGPQTPGIGSETDNTNNTVSSGIRNPISNNANTIIGVIEIPKTNVKYQIYAEVTKTTLEKAVAKQYGAGLNKEGNTVIAGHNYRNGEFFSNNKKLANGDIIYITDESGNKVSYKIYNIYSTTPEDASYFNRNTEGKKEISLTTCSDDSKERLIIWAKAE